MARPGQRPAGMREAQPQSRTGSPAWRRLRQRVRALWRWVIVRAVRRWLGGRTRIDTGADIGEVKQFPQSRRL